MQELCREVNKSKNFQNLILLNLLLSTFFAVVVVDFHKEYTRYSLFNTSM
jgi:hypothetical protein